MLACKNCLFWGRLLHCLNSMLKIILHFNTWRGAHVFCPPRLHSREWKQRAGGYWLWLGTVCALHSKWPPLPYHLWIINVQSVGLPFVIGHSDTVQFSSQPHASLSEQGSSPLVPDSHPPFPHHALFHESRRNPGQRVSATISPEERCYRDATVLCPLIIPTLARRKGPWKAFEINICVAFKSPIYTRCELCGI